LRRYLLAALCALIICSPSFAQSNAFIRINQVGYLATDRKIGIAFSKTPLQGGFVLRDPSNHGVFRGSLKSVPAPNWGGAFPYYYELDFSKYEAPGRVVLLLEESGTTSREFSIGIYPTYQDDLLLFMRQQRCGYNPYLDMVCHMRDGRTVYAPVPDGSFMDVSGGWHDAGDQLKYLITASNATARGLRLNEPDEFAEFQTAEIVYHDDVGDYSTNEPTMDGTADAILMMALWNQSANRRTANGTRPNSVAFKYHEGAFIRGN